MRAENDYEVDRSRLPSGHVLLHEVRIEFARYRVVSLRCWQLMLVFIEEALGGALPARRTH